jgi:hypothetical protein
VLPYSRRHYLQSMHVTEPKIIAAFSLELAQIAEIPKDELQPLMQCTVPPPAAPATPQGPQDIGPESRFDHELTRLDDGESALAYCAFGYIPEGMWGNIFLNSRFTRWFLGPEDICDLILITGKPLWFLYAR